jgi:putative FmdB family regulatory protein
MTYEYLCKDCKHEWEVQQKINDPLITECPKCSGHSVQRLVSGGQGFQLKGGGWYKDGY